MAGREAASARASPDRDLGMECHAPLSASYIGAAGAPDEPVIPCLLSKPLHEVEAVLKFVHIEVPRVRLAIPGPPAVLHYRDVPVLRERARHHAIMAASAVGRPDGDRWCRTQVRRSED